MSHTTESFKTMQQPQMSGGAPRFSNICRWQATEWDGKCRASPCLIWLVCCCASGSITEHVIQADIRKAFLLMAVNEEDRLFLRFLWPQKSNNEDMVICNLGNCNLW